MKIYKSTLKNLIKECLNEITEGGLDSGKKGHKTNLHGSSFEKDY